MFGSGSEFDGNAAFSGGGFMPSQTTQTADPSFAPARNREALGLVPLTVKQISGASVNGETGAFQVDGADFNNLTCVGIVINKEEKLTEVDFKLDDGTGILDVRRWTNEAVETKEMENIGEGMYVRVIGNLKEFQSRRQLVAFHVRPLTNFNELTFHFAECAYAHCYNTRLQKTRETGTGNDTTLTGHQTAPQSQFVGHFQSFDGEALTGIDLKVMEYLQQPSNVAREIGVHQDELARGLNVPVEKIMESIHVLENDGLIYNTIDKHYRSTANG